MNEPQPATRIVITDFDMPFWSLVNIMIKVALASIPATIIVSILFFLIFLAGSFVLAAFGLAVGGIGR